MIKSGAGERFFLIFYLLAFIKSKNVVVSAGCFKDNDKDIKQTSMVVTLMPLLLTLKKNLLFCTIICSLKQIKLLNFELVADKIVLTKLP